MKSPPTRQLPKLVGNLAPGASVGFAKARALDGVDTPYLTAAGPGFITRKKNGVTEVEILSDDSVVTPSADVWVEVMNAARGYSTPEIRAGELVLINSRSGRVVRRVKVNPITTGVPLEDAGRDAVWVGGGRILVMVRSAWPAPYFQWPVLVHPTNGFEVEPGDATYMSHSVSLISSAANDADPSAYPVGGGGIIGVFASGWDGTRYRWGYAFMANYPYADSGTTSPQYNNAIWVVLGGVQDTASAAGARTLGLIPPLDDFAVSSVALPTPANVHSEGNEVICVGPGKLLTVFAGSTFASENNASLTDVYVSPQLYLSSDHGSSWSRSDAAFIDALMPTHTDAGGAVRKRPWAGHLFGVYVGEGVSLVGYSDSTTWGGLPNMTVCFRYDGSGFTQLSLPVRPSAFIILAFVCFGPGCGAAVVDSGSISGFTPSEAQHIVFTHDAGATWQTSLAIPRTPQVASFYALTVIEPFIQGVKTGKVMLAWSDGAVLQTRMTDGLFQKFKSSPTQRKLDTRTGAMFGPVPFLRRTKVNLALPTEFNKP